MEFKPNYLSFNFLIGMLHMLLYLSLLSLLFLFNFFLGLLADLLYILVVLYYIYPATITISNSKIVIKRFLHKTKVLDSASLKVIKGSVPWFVFGNRIPPSERMELKWTTKQGDEDNMPIGAWTVKDASKVLNYIKENTDNKIEVILPK